jgi:hypothetical protein
LRRRVQSASRPIAALLVLLAVNLAWAAAATAGPAPARGGVRLLESMQSAPVTAVGIVHDAEPIDGRALSASLRIESLLVWPPNSVVSAPPPDAAIAFVWEERAPSRPVRFSDGDRVLVVLEALPGDSIWLERIPDPVKRHHTLHVAQRGDAFLRAPALQTVSILAHYLALAAPERTGTQGVVHLANLARGAAIDLAVDAIRALRAVGALDAKLDPTTGAWLVEALLRPDASEPFLQALLELIGRRQLISLRPALEARVRAASQEQRADGIPGLADPLVYTALIELDFDLDEATLARLGADPSAAQRANAARATREPGTLRDRVRNDPDPLVRISALDRLVDLYPEAATPTAIDALYDSDARVRGAAAAALTSIGPPAVASLRRVVDDGPQSAGLAAIQALRGIQPDGVEALVEIAEKSSDPSMQAAARLALGLGLGEAH